MHKGYMCLDISTGRIYILRDVVFDEDVFPFSKLHPNAGLLLRSQILLLPPDHQNSTEYRSRGHTLDQLTNTPCNCPRNFEANGENSSVFGHPFMQQQ
jgi:hypothetical protein